MTFIRLAIVSDESVGCEVEQEAVFDPVDWEEKSVGVDVSPTDPEVRFIPIIASAICGLVENRLVLSIAFNVLDSSSMLRRS